MNIFVTSFESAVGAWRWMLVAVAVLALCACDMASGPAAASPDPVASASAEVPLAATPAVDGDERIVKQAPACPPQAPTFTSSHGSFGVMQCELAEDDPEAPAQFQFLHRGPDGDTVGVQAIDRETLSATVDETAPKFWDGHIVTLDLPQERGGVLLIANWTGKQFAVSSYPYGSGDEDGLELDWQDGGFLVTTSTDGKRRLLAGSADSAEPGAFAQEALTCTDESDNGPSQDVTLAIDTHGDVSKLSYLASTPAVDGTSLSCSVDANRDDGNTQWSTTASGTQVITWADGEAGTEGSGEVEPSRVSIVRKGDLYTLDVQVQHAMFCGQSSELASRIVLKRGLKTCVKVEF